MLLTLVNKTNALRSSRVNDAVRSRAEPAPKRLRPENRASLTITPKHSPTNAMAGEHGALIFSLVIGIFCVALLVLVCRKRAKEFFQQEEAAKAAAATERDTVSIVPVTKASSLATRAFALSAMRWV